MHQRPCLPRTREEWAREWLWGLALNLRLRKIHQRQKIIGKFSHSVILISNLYLDIYVISICVLTPSITDIR